MAKSKRNTLAGSHPSYDKRGMTPAQISKKNAYQKKYNQTSASKKYRADLNKKNRDAGTYGNKDGKDVSHSADGNRTRMESQTANRARKTGVKQTRSPRLSKKK